MANSEGTTPVKKTAGKKKFEYASAGRHTTVRDNGTVDHNLSTLSKLQQVRAVRRSNAMTEARAKTASLFSDGELGPVDAADSNNIGYYSFQFPVDAMEMPSSRAEEMEFYRLAYTRDPIVARAIDLHTELPCSKMRLEKSKCSVDSFADYVYDWYQRLMNDTRLFNIIIQAVREYHIIGEAFMFVEQPEGYGQLKLCPTAAEALKKGRGFQAGVAPLTEAANGASLVGQERSILPDFIQARRKKQSSTMKKTASKLASECADHLIGFSVRDNPDEVQKEIVRHRKRLARAVKAWEAEKRIIKAATDRVVADVIDKHAGLKTAAPPEPMPSAPATDAAPAPEAGAGELPTAGDLGADAPEGDMDLGADGDAMPSMGGGGGGGMGGPTISGDQEEAAQGAVAVADDAKRLREINDLKRYVHLLERKKELLEQLRDLAEERKLEEEIFSHVVNDDYEGFERIQILQPERITLDARGGSGLSIHYKPSDQEKAGYLDDTAVSKEVKNTLESDGAIDLNQNPFKGSYVLQFARKKSGYELHGRSILQSPMRQIIYREKLRQVQTTLASRNMTPKTLITAPGVSELQVAELRAHADEAKADPDYTIVTNYEVFWNEIDSQGRLLGLADEWQHTNANLAIGLGFSPEILIGEGMYSGNRVQLDLMAVTYTQFREELSDLIENNIFKPIALLKGFYEMDNYGRPRWIYPKVTFGQLALRDTGDLYDMLFNLYSKGSLPVEAIYELLGLDTETVTRQLEDELFTVRDSKFNELLSSVYATASQSLLERTDLIKRLAKGMNLHQEQQDSDQMEGSGEGM